MPGLVYMCGSYIHTYVWRPLLICDRVNRKPVKTRKPVNFFFGKMKNLGFFTLLFPLYSYLFSLSFIVLFNFHM
jgi:hypothetical protein